MQLVWSIRFYTFINWYGHSNMVSLVPRKIANFSATRLAFLSQHFKIRRFLFKYYSVDILFFLKKYVFFKYFFFKNTLIKKCKFYFPLLLEPKKKKKIWNKRRYRRVAAITECTVFKFEVWKERISRKKNNVNHILLMKMPIIYKFSLWNTSYIFLLLKIINRRRDRHRNIGNSVFVF